MILPLALAALMSIEVRPAVDGIRCEITGFRAGNVTVPLERPFLLDGKAATIVIPRPETMTELTAVARGCWIDTIPVVETAAADVWPEATIIGGWSIPPEANPPRSVAASFIDAKGKESAPHLLRCDWNDLGWRCSAPARRPMHVKLQFDRFAPAHLWDIEARDGATFDSGIQELFVGGSVTGRATDARGRPLENAAVELSALTAGNQSPTDRALARYTARTNAKGAFRFAAVAEGIYRVRSAVPKRSDATLERVDVSAGAEVELADALVHRDLADLEVVFSPPVSDDGKSWRIRLRRPGLRLDESVVAADGTATEAGLWSRRDLQAGTYDLSVLDDSGSEIERRVVDLRGGLEQIVISITAITVRGRVTSGDAGVEARIEFDSGRQRVKTSSGEDGTFRASFPAEGKWKPTLYVGSNGIRIMLEEIEIRRDEDDELMLALPPGRVRGRVVDGAGRSIPAAVALKREHRWAAQGGTEDDGTFEIIGIEPGEYSIEADAEEGLAGPLLLVVGEKKPAEVELRVGRWGELRGTVVTAAGAPASGAVVRLFYESTTAFEDAIADARGMFSFQTRPREPFADLIILAPPHPIAVRRLDTTQFGKERITVRLGRDAAKLRVFLMGRIPPWPTITGPDGIARSMRLMLMPLLGAADWQESYEGGFQLSVDPGPYVVCFEGKHCQRVQAGAHSIAVADLIPSQLKETRP